MQLGMIGLGRMGANMVRRLMRDGHACVVQDVSPDAVAGLAKEGATGSSSIEDFLKRLSTPRTVCLMVPAAIVDSIIDKLLPHLDRDDVIIDGGNSHYHDDIARAKRLQPKGIHYVDMGTSGGVWGLERGYCLMIGGEEAIVKRLDPIFKTLAPGRGDILQTPGREKLGGTAESGYLHCGPSGAGHFVKMVHNGIEYGLMAAYAEGLNILKNADIGKRSHEKDAEPRRSATPSTTSTTSISPTSPSCGVAAASSAPGCSISPRRRSPATGCSTHSVVRSRILARVVGPSPPRMMRECPRSF